MGGSEWLIFLQQPLLTSAVKSWLWDVFLCYWVIALVALLKYFSSPVSSHCSIKAVNFIPELLIVFEMFSLRLHSLVSLLYLQGNTYVALEQVPRDTVESPSSEMLTAQLAKALSKPRQLWSCPCSEQGLGPDALQIAPADRIDYSMILLFTVMVANLLQVLPLSAMYLIFFSLWYYQILM